MHVNEGQSPLDNPVNRQITHQNTRGIFYCHCYFQRLSGYLPTTEKACAGIIIFTKKKSTKNLWKKITAQYHFAATLNVLWMSCLLNGLNSLQIRCNNVIAITTSTCTIQLVPSMLGTGYTEVALRYKFSTSKNIVCVS